MGQRIIDDSGNINFIDENGVMCFIDDAGNFTCEPTTQAGDSGIKIHPVTWHGGNHKRDVSAY